VTSKRTVTACAVVLAAVVAAVVGGSRDSPAAAGLGPIPAARGPLLGLDWSTGSERVVRFDPLTLRPLRGRGFEPVGEVVASSLSPDGTRLALSACCPSSVAVVDVGRMKGIRSFGLSSLGGGVEMVRWSMGRRLFAFVEGSRVVGLDPRRSATLWDHALPGRVLRVAALRQGLVLLCSPWTSVGASHVVVVTNGGQIRSVELRRIESGVDRRRGRAQIPGLTVDASAHRAFVVPPAGPVAQVELPSLGVSYHPPSRRRSLLARLRTWLEPTADAKGAGGPTRIAAWAGNGLIAVSGRNGLSPAGLALIDTRRWRVRSVDPSAEGFALAGRLILAWGREGLNAFDLDGRRRFHLSGPGGVPGVSVYGRRAYVPFAGRHNEIDGVLTRVVELPSGRVVRTVAHLPALLTEPTPPAF
jgi:hypothetical protein